MSYNIDRASQRILEQLEILDELERAERRIRFALFLVWLTSMVMNCFATAAILSAVQSA